MENAHLSILSDGSSYEQPDQCIKWRCFSECVQHGQSASQDQEENGAIPCGLQVILRVLFHCIGGQQGLYLGPSTLLKEFPWSSAR